MILRRFFLIIIALSVFSLSQRYLLGNFNFKTLNTTSQKQDSTEHFHEHSFLSEMKFFVLGFLVHSHEHTHDDSDTQDTHGGSKPHSHAEISQIKTDFVVNQNYFFYSDTLQSKFGTSLLNLHDYDHPFQIFRPPILA